VNGVIVATGLACAETHLIVGKPLERLAAGEISQLPKVGLESFLQRTGVKFRAG
jgi:hypothetical protein